MKNSYLNILINILLLAVSAPALVACNSQNIKTNSTGVPASVYRNSLSNLPSHHYYSSNNVQKSIFRPDFINLLVNINREEGPLDIFRLKEAVDSWNTVITGRNELITYDAKHFHTFSKLGEIDKNNCSTQNDCKIDLGDIIIIQSWLRWEPTFKVESTGNKKPALHSLQNKESSKLTDLLNKISKNDIGRKLIDHAIKTGLQVKLKKLGGKHGYYSYNENLVVIDPKVINYEFNLRYLVHELVHASNQTIKNSIEEEVLAEYIGLMIQNQITEIPFELNAYSIFIDHVLHDEYGKLPVSNNIQGQLIALGINI